MRCLTWPLEHLLRELSQLALQPCDRVRLLAELRALLLDHCLCLLDPLRQLSHHRLLLAAAESRPRLVRRLPAAASISAAGAAPLGRRHDATAQTRQAHLVRDLRLGVLRRREYHRACRVRADGLVVDFLMSCPKLQKNPSGTSGPSGRPEVDRLVGTSWSTISVFCHDRPWGSVTCTHDIECPKPPVYMLHMYMYM